MKKQNGISLIALIITIVVIIIIAATTITIALTALNESTETKIDVEISELSKAVQNRITRNIQNPSRYPFVGARIDDVMKYVNHIDNITPEEIQEIEASLAGTDYDYFRLVSAANAETLGVDGIVSNHYFIVDYFSGKVYGLVNMDAVNAD